MDNIAAVVLVAGKGTRMLPLTEYVPKPMLEIAEKNLIEHKLEALPDNVNEIVFVVGYLGEVIRNYFGDSWKGKRVRYVEQKIQDGTAGALWCARELLPERFLVMMGDDLYSKEDIAELISYQHAICVMEVTDREMGGGVIMNSEGKFITVDETKHFVKKGYINTGMYMLDRTIFDYQPVPKEAGSAELGLPQTLALLAKEHSVDVILTTKWFQVTAPEDLVKGELFLKNL